MAPSVLDDLPETSLWSAAAADCTGEANSGDVTFDCGDTASLSLNFSRSFSDEEGDGDHDMLLHVPTGNPDVLQIIDSSLEDATSMIKMIWQQASNDVWGVKELRPIQEEALMHIVEHQSLLLIGRTGIGKTHFVRMVGTIFGGIVVVVVPLLALMGDQMTKMKREGGNGTEVYNLDQLHEEAPGIIEKDLIPRLNTMKEGTTSTVFLLTSPHYLTRNPAMVNAIIEAKQRNVLTATVFDEGHLFAAHSFFRPCIPLLGDLLWKHIFPKDEPDSWPKLIAMTATMPNEYVEILQSLVGGVPLGPSRTIRPRREDFEQRNLYHEYLTRSSNNPYQNAVNRVKTLITGTEDTFACVFTTLESRSKKISEQLEKALNAAKCGDNIVHVSGSMGKLTKFTLLQLLNEKSDKFNLRGLVSTGAANTGIDLPNVRLVARCGVPPNLHTLIQERGRLAREVNADGTFLIIGNIASVTEQIWLIYNPVKKQREDLEEIPLLGMNSALVASRESGDTDTEASATREDMLRQREEKFKPTGQQLLQNRQLSLKMFDEVLGFLFLDRGCQHVRLEQYLATGIMQEADLDIDPCGHACPVCRRNRKEEREWDSIFHQLHKGQFIAFLESRIVQDALPLTADRDSLTNLLWKADDWVEKIFGKPKKAIAMYVVESAFLQLVAAKIIVAEYHQRSKELKWILNRVNDGGIEQLCYRIDDYWDGINLFE